MRSAETIANPGKHVSQSPVVAADGVGMSATSSTALQPLASASIPVVPMTPVMLTSLAAVGRSAGTTPASARSSSDRRCDELSHCEPV